jgi:pyruvate/2-oxoglutarate dehydrogenase complex dihydrolipoamide acyltransferase (E2) component
MRTTIKLPKLSETVDEMIVVEWLVAVGDRVEMDQSIVNIETDKATVELPAPVAGVLVEILVQPDDEVVTGAKLAVIETGD